MNLTNEGEITLPWNDFLNYTLFDIESRLQVLNVHWVLGVSNPFPAMRASSGAIGGVEFGVEPQVNNTADQPYTLKINKFLVEIDGISGGLLDSDNKLPDTTNPSAEATSPADNSSITPTTADVTGIAFDADSGVSRVRVRVQQRDVSPRLYWDGSAWTPAPIYPIAQLNSAGTAWTLPNVDLTSVGDYRIHVLAYDNVGNFAKSSDNPFTNFSVN